MTPTCLPKSSATASARASRSASTARATRLAVRLSASYVSATPLLFTAICWGCSRTSASKYCGITRHLKIERHDVPGLRAEPEFGVGGVPVRAGRRHGAHVAVRQRQAAQPERGNKLRPLEPCDV